MTPDDRKSQADRPPPSGERGEIVQTTVPPPGSDAVDIPDGDPHNETPTDTAGRLQQAQTSGIIPDNEDG